MSRAVIDVRRLPHGAGIELQATLVCPFCARTVAVECRSIASKSQLSQTWAVCPGNGCGRAILVIADRVEKDGWQVLPAGRSTFAPPGVPEPMAKEFREALGCQLAGFHLGAAVVGRRVLQKAVRATVGKMKNLKTEIEAMPPDLFPKAIREAAQHVRLVGNDAAHEDPADPAEVTAEDADELLRFTSQVLQILYVTPAEVAAATARRTPPPAVE